jgi:hypothetical protein
VDAPRRPARRRGTGAFDGRCPRRTHGAQCPAGPAGIGAGRRGAARHTEALPVTVARACGREVAYPPGRQCEGEPVDTGQHRDRPPRGVHDRRSPSADARGAPTDVGVRAGSRMRGRLTRGHPVPHACPDRRSPGPRCRRSSATAVADRTPCTRAPHVRRDRVGRAGGWARRRRPRRPARALHRPGGSRCHGPDAVPAPWQPETVRERCQTAGGVGVVLDAHPLARVPASVRAPAPASGTPPTFCRKSATSPSRTQHHERATPGTHGSPTAAVPASMASTPP